MKYYRPHEAAKMLGISKQTLIRWEKEERIPPIKRDYLNYRAYTEQDIENIRKIMGLGILREPFLKVASK